MRIEPMSQPRADELAEALTPLPLLVRALLKVLVVASLLSVGYVLGVIQPLYECPR